MLNIKYIINYNIKDIIITMCKKVRSSHQHIMPVNVYTFYITHSKCSKWQSVVKILNENRYVDIQRNL